LDFPFTRVGQREVRCHVNAPFNKPSNEAVSAQPASQIWAAVAVVWVGVFVFYVTSLAPGLTWAHQGADGGELIAAAVTNGVPHPPGYPLYIIALQGWLALIGLVAPASDLGWRGNLFSALFGSASAALTVIVAAHLLPAHPLRWMWAILAGVAWAISPLLWSQSVITEVYSLHAFFVVLLAWAVLVKPLRLWYVVAPVAFGVAHHLTLLLVLPAALYTLTVARTGKRRWLHPVLALAAGAAAGALLYLRIPLAAAAAPPPPINWGYADNWDGFRWLVSGAAYRGYLVNGSFATLFEQISAWAYLVTDQFTPVGLALAFVGLAVWDRSAPTLRNFSLLWIAPVSVYAIVYYTRDSEIYLLPVVWLMSILMAVGLAALSAWLASRVHWPVTPVAGVVVVVLLFSLTALRWSSIALPDDHEARNYVAQVAQHVEPESIVITLNDRETFAIWYGTWGDRSLQAAAPGLIPVNESLYQFEWYQRLQRNLYPDTPGIDISAQHLVDVYAGVRPIYFAEAPAWIDAGRLEKIGPLWRLNESR
jgi:hypothetical protein